MFVSFILELYSYSFKIYINAVLEIRNQNHSYDSYYAGYIGTPGVSGLECLARRVVLENL